VPFPVLRSFSPNLYRVCASFTSISDQRCQMPYKPVWGRQGKPSPDWKVRLFKKLKKKNLPIAKILEILKLKSRSTLHRWSNMSMSRSSRKERLEGRRSRALLSPSNELILAGYIVYRDVRRRSTASQVIKRFSLQCFKLNINPPWLSRFVRRHSMSYKSVVHAGASEFLAYKRESAVKFLDYVRSLNKTPRQIWVFDKTRFSNRSIGMMGKFFSPFTFLFLVPLPLPIVLLHLYS